VKFPAFSTLDLLAGISLDCTTYVPAVVSPRLAALCRVTVASCHAKRMNVAENQQEPSSGWSLCWGWAVVKLPQQPCHGRRK